MFEFTKNTATTSFVDCGDTDNKLEIKKEETIEEDPLSIKMEAENIEETIKLEIEEEIQKKNSYFEQKSDKIKSIDIMEHKIEVK